MSIKGTPNYKAYTRMPLIFQRQPGYPSVVPNLPQHRARTGMLVYFKNYTILVNVKTFFCYTK